MGGRHLGIVLETLPRAPAQPLLGPWVLAVAAILLRRLLVQVGPAWGSRRMLLAGSTGGIIGVISAGPALLAVAADPA